jgi:SAM-dependent methyltransferase
MVCHGELAALKPDPRRLTAFYLLIAAGGALGGIFVGILAPTLFQDFYELHIGFAMTWFLFLVALAANPASPLYRLRHPPAWYPLIIIAALLIAALYGPVTVQQAEQIYLDRVRNFYGVIEVLDDQYRNEPYILLRHNGILHGMQAKDPAQRMNTTAYYDPESGIGRLLTSLRARPIRMGAVGLGAGTLAAAGKPGDVIRFYEIDADVERIAREHFTFISGSPAAVEVILGDARLSLERQADQNYDVLALDAFSGDGIPFHLMTRQAMETYLRHVRPDGVIAFHISNRHLNLAPVVAGLANHFGLHSIYINDDDATWALLARQPASLDGARPFASPDLVPQTPRLWTDDYASLLPILKWRARR